VKEASPQCDRADYFAETPCAAGGWKERWLLFQRVNRQRRAIREFDGDPVADEDIEAMLAEGFLAPSSGNSQPFEIHWLRDPAIKAAGAAACRNQRAARTASTLLVFVAASRFALETASLFRAYVESTDELTEESRAYHLRQLKDSRLFLRIAPSILWSPLHSILTALVPSLSLVPLGPKAVRNWAARSALFAAQTILLAASARGLDSCPMEGFDARKLSRVLGLKRGDVIPIVIAVGRRREGAHVDPRWRRPFERAVRIH
jgi:nitroreductase